MTPTFVSTRGVRLAGILAFAMISGTALAQSAASSIDQPTPGTLPRGVSTVPGDTSGRDRTNGPVASPSAIQPSTDVMTSEGGQEGGRTDPAKHLPKDMRR